MTTTGIYALAEIARVHAMVQRAKMPTHQLELVVESLIAELEAKHAAKMFAPDDRYVAARAMRALENATVNLFGFREVRV